MIDPQIVSPPPVRSRGRAGMPTNALVKDNLTVRVIALADLDLEGLRSAWRDRYGPPPKLRSPDLLRKMLAWRLQADQLGGVDAATRRALLAKAVKPSPKSLLSRGARISREWQGRRYDVEQINDGYLFDGKTYRSLSEVAREITGVRWNGPRFFGLRKSAR